MLICVFAPTNYNMQEQEYLMISTSTEMVRLREENVVCITSDGNYSHICAIGGEPEILDAKKDVPF